MLYLVRMILAIVVFDSVRIQIQMLHYVENSEHYPEFDDYRDFQNGNHL